MQVRWLRKINKLQASQAEVVQLYLWLRMEKLGNQATMLWEGPERQGSELPPCSPSGAAVSAPEGVVKLQSEKSSRKEMKVNAQVLLSDH